MTIQLIIKVVATIIVGMKIGSSGVNFKDELVMNLIALVMLTIILTAIWWR